MTRIGKPTLHFALLMTCLFYLWFFGVTNLKGTPIANDEFNTIARIRHISLNQPYSIPDTLDKLSTISPDHGPLYFLLMNLWQRIAGADLFSMRLPSVFFGLLALATAYRIALLGGRVGAGLTGVILLCLLSFFLYYTHTARMYTLLALVAGWIVWSYWQVCRSRPPVRRWKWLLLFVSCAAITYIHYSGVMLLGAIALYHLVFVKKCQRWWRIALVVSAAVLLFIPWLPVVIEGLAKSSVLSDTRLLPLESLAAGFSIYSNGIVILPVVVSALILRYRKRISPAEQYILLVTLFAVLLVLLLNEITPVLVEMRLRYLTFIALPAAGALALGLQFLPGWKKLRIAFFCIWVVASFTFARSSAFNVYTNRRALREDKLAHYQAFQYDLRHVPGYGQLIISFHPQAPIVWKTIEYYRAILDRWKYVVHITYDQAGKLRVESGIPPRTDLEGIALNNDGIWVIHNPLQTDLSSMDVYNSWFLQHFKPCKRFVEEANNVIQFYLKRSLPCGLVYAELPFAILYDNGTELSNLVVEKTQDALNVYFWWHRILQNEFSFSLQVFDRQSNKVTSKDAVIWREPLDVHSLDIRSLHEGEYTLKLIVYDFESHVSQPGVITGTHERFERAVEIARFSVGD